MTRWGIISKRLMVMGLIFSLTIWWVPADADGLSIGPQVLDQRNRPVDEKQPSQALPGRRRPNPQSRKSRNGIWELAFSASTSGGASP